MQLSSNVSTRSDFEDRKQCLFVCLSNQSVFIYLCLLVCTASHYVHWVYSVGDADDVTYDNGVTE